MHDWDLSAAIATTMAPEPNRAGAPVANIDTEESIPTVESESNDSIHSLFGSRSDNDGIRNRDVPEAPPIGPIQLPPNNQTVSEYWCSTRWSILTLTSRIMLLLKEAFLFVYFPPWYPCQIYYLPLQSKSLKMHLNLFLVGGPISVQN